MLITFTLLIILSIGAFIVSMYSSILPFAQSIWSLEQNNQAYYEAYANIENALLVSKYQWAWFSGSWWSIQGVSWWPHSNKYNKDIEESYRTIESTTQNIPSSIHHKYTYINDEEKTYAIIKQWETVRIPLTIDTTDAYEQYYTIDNENTILFDWNQLALEIILPQKIKGTFWDSTIALLCDQVERNCTIGSESQIVDNIIVNREFQWKYLDDDFSIIPHTNINDRIEWEFQIVDYIQDTNIREFVINNESSIIPNIIRENGFNPIKNNTLADDLWKQNSLWIAGEFVQDQTFQEIFTNENIKNLSLQISFDTPAISRNSNIYPFLLYQIQSTVAIADAYYTIQGVGMKNDQQISIQITKSL